MKYFFSSLSVKPWLAFFLTYLVLLGYHHAVILHPNSYLFGDFVDGLKNYFTPLYHILYDSHYSWFEGMNYPQGEHIVFADAQPLLSNTLKFISHHAVDISGYTVGIMNFLMFFSIPLSAAPLSWVLTQLKVEGFWNIIGALFIALLSPQLFRMGGHFALAYSFVIPLLIGFWFWQWKKTTWQKSLVIGVSITLISGLHFYYFAIAAFFLGLSHGVRLLSRHRLPLSATLLHGALQVVLPFVLLQLWLFFTDPVADRPNNPFGFMAYRAHWESILLPVGKPLGSLINAYVTPIRNVSWEGIAYVGLPAFVFVILFLVLRPLKKWKAKLPESFSPLLWSGIALAFFAMGVPFVFGLEWLVEYSGPLKQFRGIGRFAWLFYYVINLAFFSAFVQLQWKKAWVKPTLSVLLFAALVYEVHVVHQNPFYQKNKVAIFHQPPGIKELQNQSNHRFSALLPLPFFLTGSENIWYGPEGSKSIKKSFVTSLQTGLPIAGVQMSRTSLTHTLEKLKVVKAPLQLPNWLPDQLPLRVLVDSSTELTAGEKQLLSFCSSQKGHLVYSEEEWFNYHYAWKDSLNQLVSLYQQGFVPDSIAISFEPPAYQQDFSDSGNAGGFMGLGKPFLLKEYTPLFTVSTDSAANYTALFWYYLNEDVLPTVNIIMETFNPQNELVSYEAPTIFQHIEAIKDGWGLISVSFSLPAHHHCKAYLHKNTVRNHQGVFDEVLVLRNEASYFNNEKKCLNNLPL